MRGEACPTSLAVRAGPNTCVAPLVSHVGRETRERKPPGRLLVRKWPPSHASPECPVNPSGGLIACGHPVGATGLMQAVFAIWQLQGTVQKHFGDNKLQVKSPRRGAIHSHAGTGTYVTVSILERQD